MALSVQWINDGVAMPNLDFEKVSRWIELVAVSHSKLAHELTYIFCDDSKILEVNKKFLNHDYFTDVITFDYTRGKLLRGDIYISLDTVASNAVMVGADYDTELLRVIIHGVLHLCGINDKGPGEREIMEAHENSALDIYFNRVLNNEI